MPATLDARTLRDAMSRYLEALSLHREEIDSLNVFPVPDGDTGTNMLLTQQAVEDALRGLDGAPLAEVAEAISRAALLGARGNSGVILSQVLRGMCARLSTKDDPGAIDLAEALAEASEEARRAVGTPMEGTMLTVIRDAATAATAALAGGESCEVVARAALEAATGSLERTREQLPALAEAGVVDAGGKGVVLLLDALVAALAGVDLSVGVGPLGPVGVRAGQQPFRDTAGLDHAFEVMFLLDAVDDAVPGLKQRLEEIGGSLVVVGGGGLFNVHVHTNEPGRAVEAGIEAGRPRDIRITSLTDQVEEACLAGQARAVRGGAATEAPPASMVAVVEGEGFAELFRSVGAEVVAGGPGHNPSVGELVAAIERAPARTVFVLANHRNVLPAARAAAAQVPAKIVEVLPTATAAHGLGVATAFVPGDDDAHETLVAALARGRTGALAVAERDAGSSAGAVHVGSWVGIAYQPDERIVAVAAEPAAAAVQLVRQLDGDAAELLSLAVGAGADAVDASRVEAALRDAFPRLEIEVYRGGQPRYPFLIGTE